MTGCGSVRLNLGIQIAYANLGNVDNPQANILYVAYTWDSNNVYVRVQLKCLNFTINKIFIFLIADTISAPAMLVLTRIQC